MNIGQKTAKFISLNIKYLIFEVYSIENRLKRICKSLYSVFIHVLHNVPTSLELGLYDWMKIIVGHVVHVVSISCQLELWNGIIAVPFLKDGPV